MENLLFVLETLVTLRSHEVKKCPAFGGAQLSMTLKQEPTHTLIPTNQKFTHAHLHPSRKAPWKHPLGPRKTKQPRVSLTRPSPRRERRIKSWTLSFDLLKHSTNKATNQRWSPKSGKKKKNTKYYFKKTVKCDFHVLIRSND